MIPSEVLSFIKDHDRFLISTHINPDGDGLGSAMALKWAILRLGKKAEIVIESDPPKMFDFFANYDWIKTVDEQAGGMGKSNVAIIVDAPTVERIGNAKSLIADDADIICIDHHVSSENFGNVNYIDHTSAASAEMVYRIIKALGLSVEASVAEYIYTGILIDTGRFKFSNTSPAVLAIASELVAAGADPSKISERLYSNNTYETTMALGKLLESIELHLDKKVATCQFDLEFVSSDDWGKVDTEGFVNHALAIQGVEVAALLREPKPGVTRASLRAKHDFDVNELASVFGGGGHAKAAGCTINAPLEEAKKMLLEEIGKRLQS